MTLPRVRKIMSDIDAFEAGLRPEARANRVKFHPGSAGSRNMDRDADIVVCTRYEARRKGGSGRNAVESTRAEK
jgi:hypothetical protein